MNQSDDLVLLRQLVDRYADAVDRRDIDGFSALFGDGGTLTLPALGPGEASTLSGDTLPAAREPLAVYERTFHHVGAAVFDVDGDTATGRVQCSAHHYERTHNGPIDLVRFIVYGDEYRRSAGAWTFASRVVDVRWTEAHPAHRVRR